MRAHCLRCITTVVLAVAWLCAGGCETSDGAAQGGTQAAGSSVGMLPQGGASVAGTSVTSGAGGAAQAGTGMVAAGTGGTGQAGTAMAGVGIGGTAVAGSGMAGVGSGGTAIAGAGMAGAGSGGTGQAGTATAGASGMGAAQGGASAGDAPDGAGGGGEPNAEPTFRVFLLLGQSNMEGYPKAQQADRAEDQRIRVLGYDDCASTGRRQDEWDVAAPPLHSCWNDGLGPGDYFAKTLIDALPEGDSIGLVPCAINGERIETFMKVGGSKYDWILQRARLAQNEGGVIEGILFHQGESNSGDPAWPGKVNTLVEDLRADLALGPVPFVAGELLYSGSTAGHNSLINQLPSVVDNAYVVSAEGLVVDPSDTQWGLHFDHDSQVTLGMRYAQKMIEARGW